MYHSTIHVLSWTDWSTRIHYWEFNIPSNSNITFDHNIPHLLATRDCNYAAGDFPSLANATTNVRNTAYHSKTPSESTFCVVCCLVPVLIMLHSLDLLWALDEANYVSTSVWGEVEQHHEAHQVPYLTPKKVALVFLKARFWSSNSWLLSVSYTFYSFATCLQSGWDSASFVVVASNSTQAAYCSSIPHSLVVWLR